MATIPPTYSFPSVYYNPVFFPSISGYLTLAQANSLFLARTGIASSVAITTSFTGSVVISGLLTLSGGLSLTGGLTVDNLIVNTLATLNTNTIINNILTINASSSIIGQSTFTLLPILPSGYQFLTTGTQTITGSKTFSSVITSNGINDSLSITSPNITGSTIVNGGTFNATNIAGTSNLYGATISGILSCNVINNTSSTLPLSIRSSTIPTPTTTNGGSGLQIGWNGISGIGATDFINLSQGGVGGFYFSAITATTPNRYFASIGTYGNYGLWLYSNSGRLRIDDRNGGAFWWGQSEEGSQMQMSNNGISTSITLDCGNASGVGSTCITVNTTAVTIAPPLNTSSTITSTGIITCPSITATNIGGTSNFWGLQTGNVNISGVLSTANVNIGGTLSTEDITAQGLTTFNTNHPTTNLGNNISTNTTQYATVGYVNSIPATTLLTSNNTWTGTNNFYGGSQLTDTLLLGTTVVSGNLQVNGNIILPLTITSVGMNITYASIPPYIIFLPIAGMSFTLPAPSASNNGQKFVIRRYGVGGGQTIIFNCVGNLAVWVPLNAGPTGNTTLAISSIWQFTIVSTGAVYLTIA